MAVRVVIVDVNPRSASTLEDALNESGYEVAATVKGARNAHDAIRTLKPDAVVIDADSPARDTLEELAMLNRDMPKPMIMLSQSGDGSMIRVAAQAGVSLYFVDHISPNVVRSLVDVSMLHFHDRKLLSDELETTRQSMQERKLIDRARCVLMERRGLGETEAYKALQRMAMDRSQSLVDVARIVLQSEERSK